MQPTKIFPALFCAYLSPSFAANPRVVRLAIGSAPVEQGHKTEEGLQDWNTNAGNISAWKKPSSMKQYAEHCTFYNSTDPHIHIHVLYVSNRSAQSKNFFLFCHVTYIKYTYLISHYRKKAVNQQETDRNIILC